jgi:hypothetical protein
VYEHVYEYGKNPGANTLQTYSYTYSYTRISSSHSVIEDLAHSSRMLENVSVLAACDISALQHECLT